MATGKEDMKKYLALYNTSFSPNLMAREFKKSLSSV